MNEKNAPPDRTEVKGLLTGAALYLGWQADMSITSYFEQDLNWLVFLFIPALTVALCVRILTWKTVREWVDSLVIGCLLMHLAAWVALGVPILRRVLLGWWDPGLALGLLLGCFGFVFFFAVAVLIVIMVVLQARIKKRKD